MFTVVYTSYPIAHKPPVNSAGAGDGRAFGPKSLKYMVKRACGAAHAMLYGVLGPYPVLCEIGGRLCQLGKTRGGHHLRTSLGDLNRALIALADPCASRNTNKRPGPHGH